MRDSRPAEVHIVEDDADMRDSLSYLLRSVGLVVHVYGAAAEFLAMYRDERPGCLLFDVRMPDLGGLELLERMVADGVKIPVLLMTAYADVPMAVRALQSGAVEFIEKPIDAQDLLERVSRAIASDADRRVRETYWIDFRRHLSDLTSRERDVLQLVLEGQQNKLIASRLGVTERTVELRRSSLLKKLQVQTTAELVRRITEFEVISGTRKLALSPSSGHSDLQGEEADQSAT